MKDWKEYFTKESLQEGHPLMIYVKDVVCSGNILAGVVKEENEKHSVIIQNLSDPYPSFRCDCGQKYCKHIAALFYKNEENDRHKSIYTDPFYPDNEYYNLSKITRGIHISSDLVQKARELITSGSVLLDDVHETFERVSLRSERKVLRIQSRYKGDKDYSLNMECSKEEMLKLTCSSCNKSYIQYGHTPFDDRQKMCVHEMAMMLLTDEYIRKYQPGSSTDYCGSRIMEGYGSLPFKEEKKKLEKINIYPILNKDIGEGLSIGFKIGKDKEYNLKNINELVHAYDSQSELSLGKNQIIDFGDETFTKDSMPVFEFIHSQAKALKRMNQIIAEKGGRSRLKIYTSSIPLQGETVDAFYNLIKGQSVPYGETRMHVEQEKVWCFLECEGHYDNEGKLDGLSIHGGMPSVIKGENIYLYNKHYFSKPEKRHEEELLPLLENTFDNHLNFVVGKDYLQDFIYRIYPCLKENPHIHFTDEEFLSLPLPPKAEFRFKVETEGDKIVCRANVLYGEAEETLRALREEDFPLAAYRDIKSEDEVLDVVERLFPFYEDDKFTVLNEEETLYALLKEGLNELSLWGEVRIGEELKKVNLRNHLSLDYEISLNNNLLDLEILSKDISEAELIELLESYKQKKRFYRFRNGDFLSLQENKSLELLKGMTDDLNIPLNQLVEGKMHIPLIRAFYLDRLFNEHREVTSVRDQAYTQLLESLDKSNPSTIPSSLNAIMRPYQKEAFCWLKTLNSICFGGILADEMGLGKTLEILSFLLSEKEEKGQLNALIITPSSLVYNWEEECHRFVPSLKVVVVDGKPEERSARIHEPADITITSYDLLKRDLNLYMDANYSHQIIDEAQYIKNQKSAASKAVKCIHSRQRFALTGTPIENRLSELWSIFDYLMPDYLFSENEFKKRYEIPILKENDQQAHKSLKRMVNPFILRRLKKDVLSDLPEKIEEVVYACFEPLQQHLYDGEVAKMRKCVESAAFNKIQVLAELTKIREICCDPHLIIEDYEGPSAKKETCLQLLNSAIEGGHRVLLFSQFTSMLKILEDELMRLNIPFYKIIGDTPKEERMRLVHEFNQGDVPVFLISLKAGGTGLNLTGADVVIHYDPWWNSAGQNQATDRAHRIGQKKNVTVYRLIVKDSIEEKILLLQQSKADLALGLLEGTQNSLSLLNASELKELLS